jgi:hypothetical protein
MFEEHGGDVGTEFELTHFTTEQPVRNFFAEILTKEKPVA